MAWHSNSWGPKANRLESKNVVPGSIVWLRDPPPPGEPPIWCCHGTEAEIGVYKHPAVILKAPSEAELRAISQEAMFTIGLVSIIA